MCIEESAVEVEDCEGYHFEACIQCFEAGGKYESEAGKE
jgi:hypothetical protein